MRCTSAVVIAMVTLGCGGSTRAFRLPENAPRPPLAEFWVDPGSRPRDLLLGVGGRAYVPAKNARYTFKAKDETGFSVSYDVVGPDGREWSAKIGPEAQTEVVISRLLWGLGYHQPPLHYLPSWELVVENGEVKRESEARFRPKLEEIDRLDEHWAWARSPFLGEPAFRGLLVVLLIFNSTDLKDDNNSIYQIKKPIPGAPPDVTRWFVVRDLGAALGETGKLFPRRNWIDGFEKEPFIKRLDGGGIDFGYRGRHQELLKIIRPADLRWAATRLQRLTDEQWHDAFRAANYGDALRDRYLRKIREKITQALEAAAQAQTTPHV